MNKYKVVVLWWTSGFGKWLAEYIINNFRDYVEVTITWVNLEKWIKVASEMWSIFSNNNVEAVKDKDIVIVSVTINNTLKVIEEIASYVKPGAILADVTSVKIWPSEYMKKFSSKDVLVIPTHPMFWPFIKTIASQIFVLTPDDEYKQDFRYQWLKNYLTQKWANVYESTPLEHDKMMAVVQWLTHFNMLTIWETIRRLNFDIGLSQKFISPVYKLMTASVWRYLSQNPSLYADIQMNNPQVLKVHDVFMEVATDFNTYAKSKNTDSFIKLVEDSNKYFWEWSEEWQRYTDKIIYLMSTQVNKIKKNIWEESIFENIYTKDVTEWEISKFENNKVFLNNGKILDINEWIIL